MSLTKNYTKTGEKCRVTFKINESDVSDHKATDIFLMGDFNNWGAEKDAKTQMNKLKDGSFSLTLTLDLKEDVTKYLFKYKVVTSSNVECWIIDPEVSDTEYDGYVSQNSVLILKKKDAFQN